MWAGLLSSSIGGPVVSRMVSISVSCRFLDRLCGLWLLGMLMLRACSRVVAAFGLVLSLVLVRVYLVFMSGRHSRLVVARGISAISWWVLVVLSWCGLPLCMLTVFE